MADKPKTYPQQIQELKQELADAQAIAAKYQEQIALIPELNAEVNRLNGIVAEQANSDHKSTGTDKARLTDLQQQIDSNADVAKRLALANQQLTLQNNQLQSQIDTLVNTGMELEKKAARIDDAQQQIVGLNNNLTSLRRVFQETVAERDTVIENQSRELRSLRLGSQTNERILAELRATLENSPDTLALLKLAAGIHGKSTVA